MKKTVFGLVLATAVAAQAQTSSSTVAPAPAAAQTTVTATEAKPAEAKKWGGLIVLNPYAGVGDLKANGSKATIGSANSLGLTYKLDATQTLGLRHNFGYSSSAIGRDGASNSYTFNDPTVHYSKRTNLTLLGSEKLNFGARYYIPASELSRTVNYGIARLDVSPTWILNPSLSLGWVVSTRLMIGRTDSTNAALGGDSVLTLITGPSATYNVTDKIEAYYSVYTDARSTDFQRGALTANYRNHLYQELGASFQAGKVGINPYLLTRGDMNNGQGMGSDSTSSYELILSSTF